MTIGEAIKKKRQEKKWTQEDLSSRLCITRSAVSQWETDRATPDIKVLKQIARLFEISLVELTGEEESTDIVKDMRKVAVHGTIRAGSPLLAVEEETESVFIPEYLLPQGEVFALIIRGNSMEGEKIHDGDMAIIQRESCVEDNEIAAVIVNGDEATIKRVHYINGFIALIAANKEFKPTIHEERDVIILGKLVGTYQRRG